jgi:eukaryotic-like serine/threonine-protein kinase
MHSKFLFSLLTIITLSYFSSLTANPRMIFHALLPEAVARSSGNQTNAFMINNSGDLNFAIFQNATYGIKMLYPSNWEKVENVGGSGSGANKLIDIVRFSPPFENSNSDKSAENFDVKVDDISDIKPISLAKYSNDTIEDLRKDFNIISEDRNATAGNNNPAYKVEYTGTEEDVNLNAMIIFTIKDDKAYIISYMAEPSRYSSDLPVVQKMISSIEFVK